eukprot:COSAG05_NODE_1_length_66591_cov_307.301581_36_plen_1386_part_00
MAHVQPLDAELDAELGDTTPGQLAADKERRRVRRALRRLVMEALEIGLTNEQCFRHFSEGGAEIPEQRLHSKLKDMDVRATHAVVRALIGQHTDGGSVLTRDSFERLVGLHTHFSEDSRGHEKQKGPKRGDSGTLHKPAGFHRALLPKALSSQHSALSNQLRDPQGEHTMHAAGLPKFGLEEGQVVIQDDPEFVERFVPIQVGELVDRLLYECRHEEIFAEQFEELSVLLRKLVYVRMHDKSSEAFWLYMHHDPDDDQRRIMRAAFSQQGGLGLVSHDDAIIDDEDGPQRRLGHSLNLKLFQQLLADFCDHANFTLVPNAEMQDATNMATGLILQWETENVELEAYERGRRFVDTRVRRTASNLWGLWMPGTWRYIPCRRMCTKRKRLYYEDEWRCGLIPWFAPGGPNTWYYKDPTHKDQGRLCGCCGCSSIVQRTRVFSRLMVAWRVSQPQGLSQRAREEVVQLAAAQLAKAGGGQAGAEEIPPDDNGAGELRSNGSNAIDGGETEPSLGAARSRGLGTSSQESMSSSHRSFAFRDLWRERATPEEKAREHSSKFVFLKLFKDYPVDDIELVRPFVTPKLHSIDYFTIVAAVIVGTILSLLEGYELLILRLDDDPTNDDRAHTSKFLAIILAFGGYYVKAYFSWQNKMTAFREKLLSNLFFRVIDNNRGALAAMLYEAEMQEQREALLLFFFLHFRWLGPEDNRFVKRQAGAALKRGQLDREIETWLTEVTSINVDFDLDDAVADLTRLGIVDQLTSSSEAAAALKVETYTPVETARVRATHSIHWESGVMQRTESRSRMSTSSLHKSNQRRALATGFSSARERTHLAAQGRKIQGVKCQFGGCGKWQPPGLQLFDVSPDVTPDNIKAVQRYLFEYGYKDTDVQDAVVGPVTEQATREFQEAHGLGVDGVFGPNCAAAAKVLPVEIDLLAVLQGLSRLFDSNELSSASSDSLGSTKGAAADELAAAKSRALGKSVSFAPGGIGDGEMTPDPPKGGIPVRHLDQPDQTKDQRENEGSLPGQTLLLADPAAALKTRPVEHGDEQAEGNAESLLPQQGGEEEEEEGALTVPGLYRFEGKSSGRFILELRDEGVPYGCDEPELVIATTEFVIPAAAQAAVKERLVDVSVATGNLRRTGISFLAALRARWHPRDGDASAGADEREVLLFGVNSYDPGGRSGDTHASEAVGGACQTVLVAIATALSAAALLGADAAQLRQLHNACTPLIQKLHGREDALDWMLRQVLEATVLPAGSGNPDARVTPYPIHLLQARGGTAAGWEGDEHEHTREYLRVFESATIFDKIKSPGGKKRGVSTAKIADAIQPAGSFYSSTAPDGVEATTWRPRSQDSSCESIDAVLPRHFFSKLRVKGESEVLRPATIKRAILQLR